MQAGKGIQNESANQNHQARRPGCEASGTREEGVIACVHETGSCLGSATGENNRGMGQDPPPKSERRVGICSIVKSGGLIMHEYTKRRSLISAQGSSMARTVGHDFKWRSNPEGLGGLANPFRVQPLFDFLIPGFSLRSNHWARISERLRRSWRTPSA